MDVKEIIKKLQEQSLMKRDFVFNSEALSMVDGHLHLSLSSIGNMNELLASLKIDSSRESYITEPNQLCHEHLSEKLKINKTYYDRMLKGKHTDLLDYNVNYWLLTNRNNYLLRTFINPNDNRGIARALLSDSYKPIDNWDVCITVLDIIKDYPSIQLQAADITDRKFYMRFIDPSIEAEAPGKIKEYYQSGRGIVAGFVISNSEVGEGAFSVAPRALILACKNGVTRWEEKIRKVHLGSKLEQGHIQWSERTKEKNLSLIQSQINDAIRQWLSKEYLTDLTSWLADLNTVELKYPVDCTKNVCSELKIGDEKVDRIINHFIRDYDITPLGIAQAVTFEANQFENADEQFDTESKVYNLVSNITKYDKKTGK